MSLGFIAVVPGIGFGPGPVSITPIGVVQLIRWLGGTRRTEDLVQGVSFPGYDAQGNPLDTADTYQYADIVSREGLDLSTTTRLIDEGAPMIAAKDTFGTNIVFTTAGELIDALTRQIAWPYHTDGTPYAVNWNGTDFIMDGKRVQDYFPTGSANLPASLASMPWYVWAGLAYLGYRTFRR